jgi:hypothetical protein
LLFHGNFGSLANNRGNAVHFLLDCMALLNAPRKLFLCAQTCLVRPSGHADGADRLLHLMYILLCFSLLVTGFNPAWFRHYGFLEDEEACPPSGQGASAVCTIWLVQGEKTTGLVQRPSNKMIFNKNKERKVIITTIIIYSFYLNISFCYEICLTSDS